MIPQRLPVVVRRRARRLAVWNGAIWAVGNGLCGTTLMVYLALELQAPRAGLSVGLILAMRHFVGALQLGAPMVIQDGASRKRVSLAGFTGSGLASLALPLAAAPGVLPSAGTSIAALISLWCMHHLMQYLAMVAFWSWLADVAPRRIRGRFLGIRGRYLAAGEAAGAAVAGLHAWGLGNLRPDLPGWMPYLLPAVAGALLMLASVVPVARMAAAPIQRSCRAPRLLAPTLLAPWLSRRWLGLLALGCWFSAANGITQSAQNIYPIRVLGIGLLLNLAAQTITRLGQTAISPAMGRLADRQGNRPVVAGSLLVVATGPLFYLAASPERWGWFVGAWIVWIAYAGVNVCLPNLLLSTAPRADNAPHIAAYYAVTGVVYALSTIVGGMAFDHAARAGRVLVAGGSADVYTVFFLAGWLARSASVLWLWLLVREPPARRQRDAAPVDPVGTTPAR